LDQELCAHCGACQLACPKDLIEFPGLFPRLGEKAGFLACGQCRDCLDICPGLDPAASRAEVRLFGRYRRRKERWLGIYRQAVAACATAPQVFEASASGGSVTALLAAAMKCQRLDCVLVAGREGTRPRRAAAAAVFNPEELPRFSPSTYQVFPYLGLIKTLMRQRPYLRLGLTTLPCHTQALRKLQALDTPWGEIIRQQVVFILEIACSSNTLPLGTETLITDLARISLDEVREIRYRHGDYPGQIAITTRKGKTVAIPFWGAERHFQDFQPHRCLSCGDWMSGLSDLSVCDGEPEIFKPSQEAASLSEYGIVLVRTKRGARVLDWAKGAGVLKTWPHHLRENHLGLRHKRHRRGYYERLGIPIPLGPIPGYRETFEPVPDECLIPNLGIFD
jgi:coenzyme F420 hydrogenase subunit beta